MRKSLRGSLTLLALSALCLASAPHVFGGGRALGTITGSVRDNKGNPLAGAVISLLRVGANGVVKQTQSRPDGSFTAKIAPGRYSLRAIADGFSEVLFNDVQVRAFEQLVYRFNLEPVGSGRTAPERRNDRDNPKWVLRSSQSRRSIFQAQEGEDDAIDAALRDDTAGDASDITTGAARGEQIATGLPHTERTPVRTKGVIETYAAASSNPFAPGYAGLNFALALPASYRVDLIFVGQTGAGAGAPQRFETTASVRAGDRHRVSMSLGSVTGLTAPPLKDRTKSPLGQVAVRAVDEWIVRDGVVLVLGVDYSSFIGSNKAHAMSPRLGLQFDANARTRVRAAYAPGIERAGAQSETSFEDSHVMFKQPVTEPVAVVDGRAVMERSRRLEFGVERVLDNESSVEATAFFDTTTGRGVGLLSMPVSAFSCESGAAFINVANQQGSTRGLRVVYTRRISRAWSASAGYSFGRGQRLSPDGLTNPAELFSSGYFQAAALQLGADLPTGTRVRTVFRFSPDATVFAIDPFAGRLAVYDPSLSIMVTQELPTFGLPVRAEAVIDARNLFDTQIGTDNGEALMWLGSMRRSVRGGISVRF